MDGNWLIICVLFGEKKISVFLKLGQNRTVAEEYHLGDPLSALVRWGLPFIGPGGGGGGG
jgi:hypothetical protein